MDSITVEDLQARVGQEIGASGWMQVTQAMVDGFAGVTGDDQFIHTDPERAAREGPYGGPVAHGLLTLSLLPEFAAQALPRIDGLRFSVNYGFDRVRFTAPVPVGARLRARFVLDDCIEKAPGDWQVTWAVTVEIAGGERPALVATWLGRRYVGEQQVETA